jgi:hypothetical protein
LTISLNEWIVFDEGRYLAEQALLVTSDDTIAVMLADTIIEIYYDRRGIRHLKGSATVANHLLVDLLDETDEIDLILDLTGTFKYRLPNPQIRSGKLFSPDVHATLQFIPTRPWRQIPEAGFEDYLSRLKFL